MIKVTVEKKVIKSLCAGCLPSQNGGYFIRDYRAVFVLYNPSVTASRATSLYTREAFCLSASAHLLTTEGVCVIEYFTAESNRLVALGGTIYSFSKYGLVLLQVKS